MSDIFPDRNIVDEINSNRGSAAEHKIQYRIMQALESIALDLKKISMPPMLIDPPKLVTSDDIRSLDYPVPAPEEGVVSMNAPEVSEGRRRRRQESA